MADPRYPGPIAEGILVVFGVENSSWQNPSTEPRFQCHLSCVDRADIYVATSLEERTTSDKNA